MSCLNVCLKRTKTYAISGKTFYKIKTIGEGGYSFVIEVKDKVNQRYALKCVRLQLPEQETAIEKEIKAYKSIKSSHVMEMLDFVYVSKSGQDRMCYLLFPLMKNGSVQDVLTRNFTTKQHLPERRLLEWTVQLCKGLLAFHSHSPPIAHRDIKPGNMMLSDNYTVLITDLGSVADARVQITSRRDAVALQELASSTCTSSYRAPELFEVPSDCVITEAVDMWSVGCTMYAMAFGESPFDGSATAAVSGRFRVPNEHIYSNKFIELIRSCLQCDPVRRPTAQQMVDNIENFNFRS